VAPAVARPRSRWIVSRSVDLSLVIGGSLAGYVYLLLFTVCHAPISYVWWFWSVGFDGAHIFGTASRTFFDAEARAPSEAAFRQPAILLFDWAGHGPGGRQGMAGAAGRRLGLLPRGPPALRLHGAVQGEEPRPGPAGQRAGPPVLGRDADGPAVSPLLHPTPGRIGPAFFAGAVGAGHVGAGGGYRGGVSGAPGVSLHGATAPEAGPSEVSAFRGRHPAALADLRLPELAGRGPDGYHRTQPAIPRHRLAA